MIDSLDEALTYNPEENIAFLLAEFLDDPGDLPEGIQFILTGRPDPRLQNLFGPGNLDLIADAPADMDDVRIYASARLHYLEEARQFELARRVSTASAGSFLYARYVLDDLLTRPELPASLDGLDLPAGLDEIYRGFIRRELGRSQETWGVRYRPILELLAAARDPGLNRDQLSAATGLPESGIDQLVAAAAQYLQGAAPQGPFSLYHQSFREYLLSNTDFQIYPGEAHRTLGELFVDAYGDAWAECTDLYAIRNTPAHLLAAAADLTNPLKRAQQHKLLERLTGLLGNLDYLHTRLIQDGNNSASLERDFAAALEFVSADDDRPFLQTIGDALRRESHVLRADPDAFYVHLHNRLYRGDGGRIDQSLEASSLAPKSPWLRALHPLPGDRALARTLSGHTETVTSLAVYNQGRNLVSASSDETFRTWSLATGDQLSAWPAPFPVPDDDGESDLDLSGYLEQILSEPSGRWFVLRNMNDQVRIWDVLQKQALNLTLDQVQDMSFTPDSTGLLLLKADGFIELFRLENQQVIRRWDLQDCQPRVIAVSPKGGKIAAGGRDGQFWIWDLDPDGQVPQAGDTPPTFQIAGQKFDTSQSGLTSKGEDSGYRAVSIVDLAFSEDGRYLAAGDDDAGLYLWDQEASALVWASRADSNALNAVAVSSEAELVLSGGVDTRLRIWELASGKLMAELRGHTGQIMDIAVLAGGKQAVTAGGAGTIRVWDLAQAHYERDGFWHTDAVNTVCLSSDGKSALSGGDDGRLLFWDVDQGKVLEQRELPEKAITAAVFGQQDSYLAGDDSGLLHRWRYGQDQPIAQITPGVSGDVEMKIVALVDQPEALTAISLSFYQQQSVIWKMEGDANRQILLKINGDYDVGAIAKDGSQALLAYDLVSRWRSSQPKELFGFPEAPEAVQRIVFDDSGKLAAAGDLHGNIIVWDLQSLAARWLTGHTNYVKALALSPDGHWLLSGGWDKVIRLWDLTTGQVAARYVWELPIESCDLYADQDHLRVMVGDKQGNVLYFVVNNLT